MKNLCKLVLRPKFGLRTKSDLFYQVTKCIVEPFNGHIKTAEQRTIIQQYSEWYTGCWYSWAKKLQYIWFCQSYVQSTAGPFFS